MSSILELAQVGKTYRSAGQALTVLSDISFAVSAGETFSLVGPSGSGKTTLLGLCAGLDQPSTGRVYLNGVALGGLSEDARARLRNEQVGFIFQNFQLLPTLTALENVMVPLELLGQRRVKGEALALLEKVGLHDRAHHYPVQLSGGEQQRVALARAFSTRPQLLFADEPTGNLDEETSARVERLLFALNEEAGTTLVIVTHDLELAAKTHRTLRLRGGRIVDTLTNPTLADG